MAEYLPLFMFLVVCLVLLLGYPVAFSLAGTALAFAWLGGMGGYFDGAFLEALPNRLYGIMTNETLIAVPLFVFMGVTLERSRVAENLLDTMAILFGPLRGWAGYLRDPGGDADGGQHRHHRRHGGDHGPVVAAHHVAAQL